MSTRSMIAISDADSNFYAVYCHFDGYVSHMGKMLQTYFNSTEKAVELVNEGELRSIMPSNENESEVVLEHFEECFEKREIEYYDTMEDMLDAFRHSDREFIYLWDEELEGWIYRESLYTEHGKALNGCWVPVTVELINNCM